MAESHLADEQHELEDYELELALIASIENQPLPSSTFNPSADERPTPETMLALQLEKASPELEAFRQRWIVDLALGGGGKADAGGEEESISQDGGVFKFGPRGTVLLSEGGAATGVNASSRVEYTTLSPSARTLITYQALRDLTPYPTTTPTLPAALSAAQTVVTELQSTYGPSLEYEPIDDDDKRAFAVWAEERLADPAGQFEVDVRMWLKLRKEKDILMREAGERVGRRRKPGQVFVHELDSDSEEEEDDDDDAERQVGAAEFEKPEPDVEKPKTTDDVELSDLLNRAALMVDTTTQGGGEEVSGVGSSEGGPTPSSGSEDGWEKVRA